MQDSICSSSANRIESRNIYSKVTQSTLLCSTSVKPGGLSYQPVIIIACHPSVETFWPIEWHRCRDMKTSVSGHFLHTTPDIEEHDGCASYLRSTFGTLDFTKSGPIYCGHFEQALSTKCVPASGTVNANKLKWRIKEIKHLHHRCPHELETDFTTIPILFLLPKGDQLGLSGRGETCGICLAD